MATRGVQRLNHAQFVNAMWVSNVYCTIVIVKIRLSTLRSVTIIRETTSYTESGVLVIYSFNTAVFCFMERYLIYASRFVNSCRVWLVHASCSRPSIFQFIVILLLWVRCNSLFYFHYFWQLASRCSVTFLSFQTGWSNWQHISAVQAPGNYRDMSHQYKISWTS